MDNDLYSLSNKLRTALTGNGKVDLGSIGISTTYSSGLTQLSINEEKLESVLQEDPDKVKNIFAKTSNDGKHDGIITAAKNVMDAYASKSITAPGILVKKAGSTKNSLSLLSNQLKTQMGNIDDQIGTWETKLNSKIDYYTKQFSLLEQMISRMNNQSSMIAGLGG